MDTRNKRASAFGRSLPFLNVYATADSTIDAGDRAQTLWLYRAAGDEPVEPGEPVTSPAERTGNVQAQTRSATARAQSRTFEVT